MIKSLSSIYSYYIFCSISIILISLILFFATKRYRKLNENIYSIFLNLNMRKTILLACSIVNVMIIIYSCFFIKNFNNIILYMLIANTLISASVSLNIRTILFDIFYLLITLSSLKIFSLIYNYLNEVYYSKIVYILSLIFMAMILFYGIFITIRKIKLILYKERERKIV